MKNEKTNSMRILERNKIAYSPIYYDLGDTIFSGEAVAEVIGIPPEQNFKTLTAKGDRLGIMVFVIPVNKELNLKKAASEIGEKKIELIPVKDLLSITGYVRGEVSPMGMKKLYPTFIDDSALAHQDIVVSGGKKGTSIKANAEDIASVIKGKFISCI